MPKKFGASPFDPLDIYPDPISEAAQSAKIARLTDEALAGDMPASRLFSSLPASVARDVKRETERERAQVLPKDPTAH